MMTKVQTPQKLSLITSIINKKPRVLLADQISLNQMRFKESYAWLRNLACWNTLRNLEVAANRFLGIKKNQSTQVKPCKNIIRSNNRNKKHDIVNKNIYKDIVAITYTNASGM